jgi:hypothetical protein
MSDDSTLNPIPETPTEIGDNRRPDGTFGPGNVANPNGRPKGSLSITASIKAKLEEQYNNLKEPEERKTYLEKVIDAIFHNAIEAKDARSLKDIWNYIDGLPKGTLNIGGDKDSLEVLTEFFKLAAKPKE